MKLKNSIFLIISLIGAVTILASVIGLGMNLSHEINKVFGPLLILGMLAVFGSILSGIWTSEDDAGPLLRNKDGQHD